MLVRENGIHTLVGEYFEARIVMGDYNSGDRLPSLAKLCVMFHLAPATARAGLELLEQKGYIQIEARKAPVVIYELDRSAKREQAARYFAARRRVIMELAEAGQLLFAPLWVQGMTQLRAEDWEQLRQALAHPTEEMLSLPMQFYFHVLEKFGNDLLLNFYWEMIRYIRFPYLEEPQSQAARQLAQAADDEAVITAQLGQALKAVSDQTLQDVLDFLEQGRAEYNLAAEPEVPFRWTVYRPRPQLCYSLVAQVIRKIGSGEYAAGSYLASQPEMAEEWGVSVSTVRRALRILQSLGLVHSYQGKGTQILAEVTTIDFSSAAVKEGLRYYQESMQFLRLTFASTAQSALGHADAAAKAAFGKAFSDWIAQGRSHTVFDGVLVFMEEYCPFELIKECYRGLRELLSWGYVFTRYRLQGRELHDSYFAVIVQAAEHLAKQEESAFIKDWLAVLTYEEQKIQALLVEERVVF